jgi:hypothetical protein
MRAFCSCFALFLLLLMNCRSIAEPEVLELSVHNQTLDGSSQKSNLSSESNPSNQTFHSQLDARARVNLYWKIHYENRYLLLEVRARLSNGNARPFVAIGFSDYGNLTDADFCVLWIDKRKRMHFQVTYASLILIIT